MFIIYLRIIYVIGLHAKWYNIISNHNLVIPFCFADLNVIDFKLLNCIFFKFQMFNIIKRVREINKQVNLIFKSQIFTTEDMNDTRDLW